MPCAAVLAAAAALGACTVTEPYVPPVADPVQTAPFDAAPQAGVMSGAPVDHWWRLYDDPVLDALIQEALAQNRDLAVAAARVQRVRAALAEADAAQLPATQAAAGVDYGKHGPDQTVAAARDERAASRFGWSPGFAVSWEVDLWGRVRGLVDAAHADAQAQRAAADAMRVTVAAETARAYALACAFGQRVEVAQRSLGVAERIAALIARQQALGLVSALEQARAQAFADDTRAALPALEGERRAALYELATLTGHAPAQVPAAAKQCHVAPALAQPFPVGDGAALLRRRPDLREAERRLAAAHAREDVARASLYPAITFGGSVNALSTSGDPGSIGDRHAVAWGIGPLVSWDFPNLAASRARLGQARADADGARAAFDGQVLRALRETEQALVRYEAAWQGRDALRAARDAHARALSLAEREFRAGALDSLGVLDAERGLVAVEANLAESAQRVALDQVAVFKALGGGWQP
ncbi:outer membrane multidrug efflux protein [Bordetella ansorpii]|uniref:Outer membrane multidrug efflux protein n=2 Tax=Bordetella ansorpii TaxID=288768 RepID=A0A157PHH6_9BORD|nr:outer membrane multidrug efflux protein [Bordetella ansorpii]